MQVVKHYLKTIFLNYLYSFFTALGVYKNALFDAIDQFNINNLLGTSLNHYTKEVQQSFGQLSAFAEFKNIKK